MHDPANVAASARFKNQKSEGVYVRINAVYVPNRVSSPPDLDESITPEPVLDVWFKSLPFCVPR
jgi:hypothetical protein